MQKTIKTISLVVILSITLTSTSSASLVGVAVKAGKECIKKGCVQKAVKTVKDLVGKGAKKGVNSVKENPVGSGITVFGFAKSAFADDDVEEEVTTINNDSNRTLDLLKMEQ